MARFLTVALVLRIPDDRLLRLLPLLGVVYLFVTHVSRSELLRAFLELG